MDVTSSTTPIQNLTPPAPVEVRSPNVNPSPMPASILPVSLPLSNGSLRGDIDVQTITLNSSPTLPFCRPDQTEAGNAGKSPLGKPDNDRDPTPDLASQGQIPAASTGNHSIPASIDSGRVPVLNSTASSVHSLAFKILDFIQSQLPANFQAILAPEHRMEANQLAKDLSEEAQETTLEYLTSFSGMITAFTSKILTNNRHYDLDMAHLTPEQRASYGQIKEADFTTSNELNQVKVKIEELMRKRKGAYVEQFELLQSENVHLEQVYNGNTSRFAGGWLPLAPRFGAKQAEAEILTSLERQRIALKMSREDLRNSSHTVLELHPTAKKLMGLSTQLAQLEEHMHAHQKTLKSLDGESTPELKYMIYMKHFNRLKNYRDSYNSSYREIMTHLHFLESQIGEELLPRQLAQLKFEIAQLKIYQSKVEQRLRTLEKLLGGYKIGESERVSSPMRRENFRSDELKQGTRLLNSLIAIREQLSIQTSLASVSTPAMQIASLKQIYTQFDNIKPELEAQRTAFQAKKEKLEKEMTHCLVNNEKIESCLKTFRKEMAKLSSAIEVRKEWFKMEIAPADPWWSGIIKFLFLQKRYY